MCLEMHFFLTHANVHTHTSPPPPPTHPHIIEPFPIQYMSRNYEAHGVEAMKELDTLMAQLAVSSPLTPLSVPPGGTTGVPCDRKEMWAWLEM